MSGRFDAEAVDLRKLTDLKWEIRRGGAKMVKAAIAALEDILAGGRNGRTDEGKQEVAQGSEKPPFSRCVQ